ncbi:MAG TPA: hypothetical protein VIX82_04670, partial [Solirubrobacteraceae bacterium]
PRRRVLIAVLGLALVAGLALAACGGGSPTVVQVSSVSCRTSSTAATGVVDHPCVFTLTDGTRFGCPESFALGRSQTPARLEHAKACTRLPPVQVPASSRPVFAAVEKARSCLIGLRLRVVGGPVVGLGATTPDTPLGELIVVRDAAPTFIAFYKTSQAARQAEPMVLQNVRRLGGRAARRGAVTVLWSRPPASARRADVEACAFG